MRYDCVRRVLVVVVAGLLFLPAALFSQQGSSQLDSARLTSLSGQVTVTRAGAAEKIPATVNMPIEDGLELSTASGGAAAVALANGSTLQLQGLTTAQFSQFSSEANGGQPSQVALEKGYINLRFASERQPGYEVKVADATLTPSGKAQFLVGFNSGKVTLYVSSGAVSISAHANSLTVSKGEDLEYVPSPGAEVAKSHARVVRLSFVSGAVMLKRPGTAEPAKALLNTPIQEGFELSTDAGGYAEVEFENGSTARIGEQSQLLFHQLALDADGNKLNGMTFEQGYGTFHFVPEHNFASAAKQRGADGVIHFLPKYSGATRVKIADAVVTASGKCEFRTDLDQDHFRVEVFNGSVDVDAPGVSSSLTEGKTFERRIGGTEMAVNSPKRIVKDAWDQWAEARDKQAELTAMDEAVHPMGTSYGWGDLNTYGEWVSLAGGRFGWSPYSLAGWSPYTNGMWSWYSGYGWAWISADPWGWVTDHCGLWDFDASFGWYWMNPMYSCGLWEGSLVSWYMGPGWIGWRPLGSGSSTGFPGTGRPGPRPPVGIHPPGAGPRIRSAEMIRVPTAAFQNGQMITAQIATRVLPPQGSRIDRPPFGPSPQGTGAAMASAAASATTRGSSSSFASHHGAPSTILMGGDAAKESALLASHHAGHAPLRAFQGATLGGHLAVRGTPGEFRGSAVTGGGRHGGSSGGAPVISNPGGSRSFGGGSGAVVAAHGSTGGSHGGSSGGGYSGGARSSGASSSAGGSHSSGGGFSGGGGGGHH